MQRSVVAALITAALVTVGVPDVASAASAPTDGPCAVSAYGGDASVSLEGVAAVGAPMTATFVAGTDWTSTLQADNVAYTWSGTGFGQVVRGRTFVARRDLVGADARLVVRARGRDHGRAVSFTAVCDVPRIDWGSLAVPGAPAVEGTPALHGTLRAQLPAGALPAGARYHYEWFAGDSPSAFATGDEVRLGVAQVGSRIRVKAMVTALGYRDSAWSSATVTEVVAAGTLAQPGAPSISGTPEMAATLQASPASDDDVPSDATYEYAWFADGQQFAVGSQVTLAAGQVGHAITVRDRVSAAGYAASEWSAASAPTASVAQGVLETPTRVSVSGSAEVGQSLTAVVEGGWTPGTQAVFHWKADGEEFGGNVTTVRLSSAQLGRSVTVSITGTLAGYLPETIESAPVGPVAQGVVLATPGTPTISGTPRVGQQLAVTPAAAMPDWPADVEYEYQWWADGDPFATGSQVTLGPDQLGRQVTVVARVTAPGYAESEWSSAAEPTSAVAPGELSAPTRVSVLGRAQVGELLTAQLSGAWAPGTTVRLVWKADGTPFATTDSPVLGAAQRGRQITVEATGTLAGFDPVTVASEPTAPVARGKLATSRPRIQGRPLVGRTLTVEPGMWTDGARLTVRWFANGVRIEGMHGRRLTLTRALDGARITVRVTGRLKGYASETRTSRATARVR